MVRMGLLPWLKAKFFPKYKFDKNWAHGEPTGNKRRGARRCGQNLDRAMVRLVTNGRLQGRTTAETRLLTAWFEENDLVPHSAQVYVEFGGVFTWVDLVCKHAHTGKLVIFELKTGFRGYYEVTSGTKMLPPFDTLTDSVHNQHQLQLLYGIKLYLKNFPDADIDVASCAVLVVNESVQVYPLEHPVAS
jgi:hypothetical protein